MKKLIFTMAAAMCLPFLAAAQSGPEVTVTPENFTFPAEGGQIEVKIDTERTWYVTTSGFASVAYPAQGEGSGSFIITAGPNLTTSARTTTYNIVLYRPGGLPQVFLGRITQEAGSPYGQPVPENLWVNASEGEYKVQLYTELQWYAFGVPGLEVTPSSGTGNETLTIKVAQNATNVARDLDWYVTFHGPNINPAIFRGHVYQQAGSPYGHVVPEYVVSSAAGGQFQIQLDTELAWHTISGFAITPSSGTGSQTLTLNVPENTTGLARTLQFNIIFSGAGAPAVFLGHVYQGAE